MLVIRRNEEQLKVQLEAELHKTVAIYTVLLIDDQKDR